MTNLSEWHRLRKERQLETRLDDAASFSVGDFVWAWYRRGLHLARIESAEWLSEFGKVSWETRVYIASHRRWTGRRRFVLVQRALSPHEVHAARGRGVIDDKGQPVEPASKDRLVWLAERERKAGAR
jgi:hypothetical protein